MGLQRSVCSQSNNLYLQLTTDNSSDIKSSMSCPPSFCDLYLLWKLKHWLCHTYYYILLNNVSYSWGWDSAICGKKNIFSLKGVASLRITKVFSTYFLFVLGLCCFILILISNTAFYHILWAYPVVLNLLVSLLSSQHVLYYIVSSCWLLLY